MTFAQFIKTYNGKGIDTDGAFGYQCMDLMHEYCRSVLGLPLSVLSAPTAYQAYQNGSPLFTKIPNTPANVPQNGDIMFWNTTVGAAGHVAVFLTGNSNSFTSFDQNWPTGSLSHIQPHNYNGVAGWLRVKSAPAGGDEPVISDADNEYGRWNKLFMQIRGRSASREEFRASAVGRNWLSAMEILSDDPEADRATAAAGMLQDQVNSLNAALADRDAKITNLTSQITTLDEHVQILTKQVTDLQAQLGTQSGDSDLLNSFGKLLQQLIKRLGLK